MVKLALNFICKNEAHVVNRMLNSVKGIYDLIVVNDTGSTDGTQDIIRKFGEDNGIPTYVFERPFDAFDKSRNFAMQKVVEVAKELNFDLNNTWGAWMDCDEILSVATNFNKNQFNKDLYMINTSIGAMKYTRNTFFRLSKPFRWYGPIHEYIVCDEQNITSGLAEGVEVLVHMDGNSWTQDVSMKYISHAHTLEKYIAENRSDARWIFYTAQSYHDSSCMKDNREENEERLRRSLKYYRERVNRVDGYPEERYYSQLRIGSIMKMLEMPWEECLQELLKAYAMDPLRGESIKAIVDYYVGVNEWNLAYLYSKFLKVNFHGNNPYPKRLLFVDNSLYAWKILEMHSSICFYTGRSDEAKSNYRELVEVIRKNPELFSQDDINKIKSNEQHFK